jgi:predicted DCC family thiol-disulfide oxidoreductase YuxK
VSGPRQLILYDADCGFCRWALAWVLRWDRHRRLVPVALQGGRAAALLGRIEAERRMASWHLVGEDGSVVSAGQAAAPLLRLLPGGSPLAAVCERFPSAVERAYARVVSLRGPLGRRLGDRTLARADRLIADRATEPASTAVSG